MDSVIIWDNYQQPWHIYEDDVVYAEASKAIQEAKGEKVYWPISKLTEGRGYGWWTVFHEIDKLEQELGKEMPNPTQIMLDLNREYTPQQLRDMIQRFGSYLATLTKRESILEAQCHALKQSYENGIAVAIAHAESKSSTLKAREAEILGSNETFKVTKRLQINNESALIVVQGWRKSYEHLYALASRLITLTLGELEASRLT